MGLTLMSIMEFSSLIMDRSAIKELEELTLHDQVHIFDDGYYWDQRIGGTYSP